jgi:hypothetical protein
MRTEAIAIVEGFTHQAVTAYMSDQDHDTDTANHRLHPGPEPVRAP